MEPRIFNLYLPTSKLTKSFESSNHSPGIRVILPINPLQLLNPSLPTFSVKYTIHTSTAQLSITFSLVSGTNHPHTIPGPVIHTVHFLAFCLREMIGPMLLGHLFLKSGIDVNIGVLGYPGKWVCARFQRTYYSIVTR